MTRKLIMLAPQAHSQCSFAVRISLYASWGACPQKRKVGKKTRPTALLQVRMQSCQPEPVFFPPPLTSLSLSPSCHSLALPRQPQVWLNSGRMGSHELTPRSPSALTPLYSLLPKPFCCLGLLAALSGLAKQLTEKPPALKHGLWQRGRDQSLCNWINPILWHKPQWV